jgi:S-adenosyl-L-methionine hydrolase (adenosine-forming)
MAIITLATDYGDLDGYNAAMIGVIKSLSPAAEIVEITNKLNTIVKTSLVLWRYYASFPPGTIHLVIVDPTVGSSRRALVGIDGPYYFVGPDNGIFSRIIENSSASGWFEIDSARIPQMEVSHTFHGRDIFAPAAAFLSMGKPPDTFSDKITDPVKIDIPKPLAVARRITGEIIDIDSFGNLIINITKEYLEKPLVTLNSQDIPFGKTFTDVKPRHPIAYIGSIGLLEIAINGGRADKYYGVKIGNKVVVKI